jgi:hypothetical protein
MLQLKPSKVKQKCESTTQAKLVNRPLICFRQRSMKVTCSWEHRSYA